MMNTPEHSQPPQREPGEDVSPASATPPPIQFHLSAIFVLTLIASILAAFLSPRGDDLIPAGILTAGLIAVVAGVVGYFQAPLIERIFWGIVVTAMMQAIASGVVLLDRSGIYGWPITAGVAAIFAAGHTSLYPRMFKAAMAAGLSMSVYVCTIEAPASALLLNVVSATIGGALLGVMIEFCKWMERQRYMSQPVIGLILVLASIGFAVVAPQVIPGW